MNWLCEVLDELRIFVWFATQSSFSKGVISLTFLFITVDSLVLLARNESHKRASLKEENLDDQQDACHMEFFFCLTFPFSRKSYHFVFHLLLSHEISQRATH